jgi:hypothetical protein
MKTSTLTEEQALVTLGRLAGSAACAVHDLGVIASHLVGPVAAARPDWHPETLPNKHHAAYVDRLIDQASGGRPIRCTCPFPPNPYVRVLAGGSAGAVAYPLLSDDNTQAEVAALVEAADIDAMLHVLDPRLEALKNLSDYARAEGGGVLDDEAREAVEVLAASLCGRTRWNTLVGWQPALAGGHAERRHGLVSLQVEQMLADEGIGQRIRERLLDGR